MEVIATAHLEYWDGESLSGGSERLEIIVKFKEAGKFLKTKIVHSLASTARMRSGYASYQNYKEYIKEVEKYLDDPYLVKKEAEYLILKHFADKYSDEKKVDKKNNIHKRIKDVGKLEIKVKID
ncbi:hypothetical protein AF332_11800 [Sporosarcina globispora]|uniref:Uncharacterized protein n=1 Tax=Sporosarcina globispora TaxID=1459 RepID=A0A0M0GCI8_SPOGL|nr:hypothetical protein [Sporosarcina globispora]KON87443.1 hypothetical protein AF332_11800 [Sporosarcina globispora]